MGAWGEAGGWVHGVGAGGWVHGGGVGECMGEGLVGAWGWGWWVGVVAFTGVVS